MMRLACDMTHECLAKVSHIDDSGFVYCAHHGLARKSYGHLCRKLTAGELRTLENGGQIRYRRMGA